MVSRRPPATRLSLNNLALIVPADSDLAAAQDEKQDVQNLQSDDRKVVAIRPTLSGAKQVMFTGEYDAWHFTGHARANAGVDPDQSPIDLTKPDKLTPAQIVGTAENFLLTRPFAFLNACQSAQGECR